MAVCLFVVLSVQLFCLVCDAAGVVYVAVLCLLLCFDDRFVCVSLVFLSCMMYGCVFVCLCLLLVFECAVALFVVCCCWCCLCCVTLCVVVF